MKPSNMAGFSKKTKSIVNMKGYVARDLDGSLWFHYIKPHRENDIEKPWWGSNDKAFEIFDSDFPEFKNLSWKDAPLAVGFNIHKANIQD